MIRPRDILDKKGLISNGEKQIYEKLKRIRKDMPYEGSPNLNGHLVPMDSLIESAFNSDLNEAWGDYELSARVGYPTEAS